jgi:hypothetical protein
MRVKELLFALCCVLSGAGVAFAVWWLLDSWPSPVLSYSMLIIGLGAALVVVRYNRLGPFQGELGPPRLERSLRERIDREANRAARYGHPLTIVVMWRGQGPAIAWATIVRNVDIVIPCRKGVTLLLLPETDPDGACGLLARVNTAEAPVQAALVSSPADGRTGDELSRHMLLLVRRGLVPGHVAMWEPEGTAAPGAPDAPDAPLSLDAPDSSDALDAPEADEPVSIPA